jgi:hypothetical protein
MALKSSLKAIYEPAEEALKNGIESGAVTESLPKRHRCGVCTGEPAALILRNCRGGAALLLRKEEYEAFW